MKFKLHIFECFFFSKNHLRIITLKMCEVYHCYVKSVLLSRWKNIIDVPYLTVNINSVQRDNPSRDCIVVGIMYYLWNQNCICAVIVNRLNSYTIDLGLQPRLGQTKDYKIGICYFYTTTHSINEKEKSLVVAEAG